jgi:hypothetical protein
VIGIVAVLCTLSLVAACDLEPDVGEPLIERCDNSDTDPNNVVSFQTDIVPMIGRTIGGCVLCHDPNSGNRTGVTIGGLSLDTYAGLVTGGARSANNIVVPGAPCESTLFRKLGPGPPFGGRMPNDGPPFWAEWELNLVHDWIAEGARDN